MRLGKEAGNRGRREVKLHTIGRSGEVYRINKIILKKGLRWMGERRTMKAAAGGGGIVTPLHHGGRGLWHMHV